MNDFIKRSKYDLRETRFSENCETSIEINNQSCFDYHNPMQRNTFTSESPFKIKNNFSSIHHDESFAYMTEQTKAKNDKEMLRSIFGKKIQKNQSPVTFKKSFSCFDDNIVTRTSLESLDHSVKYESALKYLSDALEEKESSDLSDDESEEEEDVFSEKLSIIRGLEEKLSNIQSKIKVSSASPVNQKLNVSKSSIDIRNNTLSKLSNQNNIKEIEIDHKTDVKTTGYENYEIPKFTEKSSINQSLESESMLLEKDISSSEKQLSTLKNIPSKILEPEVQIVEVVRLIEIPYLIEVVREADEKIESKKSFYFEENEEIHKTFEEFTQKECLIEKSSRKESLSEDMLNIETKIKPSTIQENFQLEYSGTGIIQNPSQAIEELSMLSINESNKTFHNDLKEKQHDMSYNFEENSEILSNLLTKHNNPSQLEEFDEKLKSVQAEVEQLKESLNEKELENSELQEENKLLTSELESLIEFEFIYLEKLKQYEETLQQSKEQFNQFHEMESQKIKQHYEKIIEQYENEQSEYANRIIKFEEMFLEQQNKEEKHAKIIEEQQEQIQELNRLAVEKEREIENEAMKIEETENIVIERETELKGIIENLERDNLELKNHIRSIHARYEAEGFYILKEEAEEIKKTIEEKDESHIEELEKLENRYTNIIAKYQAELEAMKKGLEKVRIDKSVEMSKTIKSKSSEREKDSDQKNNIFRKRSNVFKTQFSNVDTELKKSSINEEKINGLDELKKEQVESTEYSEDTEKINSLLVSEITYLKEQNSQLKTDLYNERKDKHCLSQKLHEITNLMARQISQLNESESELEKNEEVLEKCVQELEKQYEINKLLREELEKTKEIMKNQIKTQKFSSEIIDEEQIKLHPIYLELNKKYIKSKKHIKILEKQLLELTLLPEFSEETNKCCQNKDMMIQELKEIAFKEIM